MICWNGPVCVVRCDGAGCGVLAGPPVEQDWLGVSLALHAGWRRELDDRHYCPACAPRYRQPIPERTGPCKLSDHWTGD